MADDSRSLTFPPPAVPLVAARELGVMVRTALWPLAKLHPLPKPDTTASPRPPVVMVHGYMGHPQFFRPITRRLLEEGWRHTESIGYPSLLWSLERIISRIDETVDRLTAEHGGPVDVIGHSLGAVAMRAWLKLHGGAPKVRKFISLGGPHEGTDMYKLVVGPLRKVFDPDGVIVKQLNEGEEPVPTTVIRARYDHQVFPPHRARIDGALEHIVDAYGHNGLLWSRKTHDIAVATLLRP